MSGGAYYVDSRTPFNVVDEAAITLATTQKALWPVARTLVAASDWSVGRRFRLTANIKAVTDGTAGNYVFGMGCGTGDAPAVIVVSTSQAGVVSKTFDIFMQGYATCRAIGSVTSATVSMFGVAIADLSGVLSTAQPITFPSGGVTVVSGFDSTVGTNALTFQMQRSGAGVWTATTTDVHLEALN